MRTEDTERQYRAIAKRLIGQFGGDTPVQWATELERMAPGWARATVRIYRAALIGYARQCGLDPSPLLQAQCTPAAPGSLPKRTSAQKLKCLSDRRLRLICEQLDCQRSWYAEFTKRWLIMGIATGLRLAEWPSVRIDSSALIVKNAKLSVVNQAGRVTYPRANGPERILHLELTEEDWVHLRSWIRDCHANAYRWRTIKEQCRWRLYLTCKRLWPNDTQRPTLYSGRHQFAADAKKAGYLSQEVGQMMGHASADTAEAHYGRKHHGRPGACRVRPDPEQVKTVRVRERSMSSPSPVGPKLG